MCKDPAGVCCLCSHASGPGSGSGTALAAGRILTGPASQYILGNCSRHGSTSHIPVVVYWSASIGLPARSPLIRPSTRRFKVRPASNHLPGLNRCARLSAEELSRPGDIYCPFIRRRRDFARGDFQEENRELTVQGCTASAVPIRRNPG